MSPIAQQNISPEINRPGQTHDQQRLLLIAPHSSYRIAPYIQAAQKLGIDVLIASTSKHSLVSEIAEGLRIDLDNAQQEPRQSIEAILEAHGEKPFTGVVATDDNAVSLAALAASAMGLPHNPPEAIGLTHRKDLARTRLSEQGVPVPEHKRIDLHDDVATQASNLFYPCVIKPLSLSGSRGVIRVNNTEECIDACQRIQTIVSDASDPETKRFLLAESYIPGVEVAVEAMLNDGELQILTLFDKPDPMEGPYFEETYYITPSRLPAETQTLIRQRVKDACDAYGLVNGPIHAELRLHNNEAWILEVAARTIGGQCARLLRYGTGYGLEELVIHQASGHPLTPELEYDAAGVLMIPIPKAGILRRIEGLANARRTPLVTEVEISVREGYELVPLPEGAAYLGFIFARGPDPQSVEAALRQAHACLNFVTAPLLKLELEKPALTMSTGYDYQQ
ncbi:ATP-grasp domain-containing protein [Kaarinaea lacus]